MFSAAQLIAHGVGDYIFQTDWMAMEKPKRTFACAIHAVTYAAPFMLFTKSTSAIAFIVLTHFVIDRWRLARYVCWLKNFIGSPWEWDQFMAFLGWRPGRPFPTEVWNDWRRPWSECVKTGFPDSRPEWLTTWILIIVDNIIHICCNAVAIEYMR